MASTPHLMIRKLLRRVFPGKSNSTARVKGAQRISSREHGIDNRLISPCALKITTELQKAGFLAFIVGGAVRDLLLKRIPKDFDIATSATPEQVHRIFRRSRIIGRRFRLVHVMSGNETVEVSTFRGSHQSDEGDAKIAESGRILRDNVFGSLEEDAGRRDFSINALYYDPLAEEIWDYHNGYSDLRKGVLRIIGDPVTRYREDPVRMLRAVRLSAKLGIKLDHNTETPIPDMAELLKDVPQARLFDEMLKLFLSGHAMESAVTLREHGLHHGLLPLLDVILEQSMGERFVTLALKNTDERILQDKPVTPAFLFAALLWHEVLAAWQKYLVQGTRPIPALAMAMHDISDTQADRLAIPKRFSATMKEIWDMQPRLEQRAGKRPLSLVSNPRYRAGYDFLLLRCQSGELPMELAEWWDAFYHADSEQRHIMLLPDTQPRKRRRRRSSGSGAVSADSVSADV